MRFIANILISLALLSCSSKRLYDFIPPQVHSSVLANGLELKIIEDHSLPEINFLFFFPAGEAYLSSDQAGLADFMTSLLIEGGTKEFAPREFANQIEKLGASLSAGANYEFITYGGRTLTPYLDDYLKLFKAPLLSATFNQEEVDREKRDLLSNFEQLKDVPSAVFQRYFTDYLYSPHPYGRPISGYESTVKRFTRDAAVNLYKKWIKPYGAILYIVGDVTPSSLIEKLNKELFVWQGSVSGSPSYQQPALHIPNSILLIDKPDSTQSIVAIGATTIPATHKSFLPLAIATEAFGGHFGSRLNQVLRVEKGLTYGANADISSKKDLGAWYITTSTRTEKTVETLKEILSLTNNFLSKGLTEKQLQTSKNYLIGKFPRDFETTTEIAMEIFLIDYFGLPKDYMQTYRPRVDSTTNHQIAESLENLDLKKIVIVVLGNAKEIMPELTKLGPVELKSYKDPLTPPIPKALFAVDR